MGTLCVIDRVPRELSAEQREALQALGRLTVTQLEERRERTELIAVIAERDRAEARASALQARTDAPSVEPVLADGLRALGEAALPAFVTGLAAGALMGALLHREPSR